MSRMRKNSAQIISYQSIGGGSRQGILISAAYQGIFRSGRRRRRNSLILPNALVICGIKEDTAARHDLDGDAAFSCAVFMSILKITCSCGGVMLRFFSAAVLVLLLGAPAHALLGDFFGSSVEDARDVNGTVTIDTSKIAKGQARHYRYRADGKLVRFFVVRDQQGIVRAALDACEQCRNAGKGYTLKDGAMLCVNCGQKFSLSRIGFVKGGCNPHPFPFQLEGETLAVATDALLLEGAAYFPENAR